MAEPRGERMYLRGHFVVNFADANRAVLRPTGAQTPDSAGIGRNVRVIVDYPAGALPVPPAPLSIATPRDHSRLLRSGGKVMVSSTSSFAEIIQQ